MDTSFYTPSIPVFCMCTAWIILPYIYYILPYIEILPLLIEINCISGRFETRLTSTSYKTIDNRKFTFTLVTSYACSSTVFF